MTVRTRLTGFDLLNDPRLNKGTAFSEAERDTFALHGLLPPHLGTLEEQIARRRRALDDIPAQFGKYRFLRDLQDTNETLFYALIRGNIEAMLPLVYTPAVGEGCQRFSEIWHQPRGLFLGYPHRDRIDRILAHPRYDDIACIVVSDGERILGLGDQGAGGMGIPIGKLALYTALGGIRPERCLPVLLDVGTDNEERLAEPLYIGWSHRRVRGQEYDDFVEAFVTAAARRWPRVLLQWEDFAGSNAARLLERYRDRICSFNDDIQGTAAVATAALLAAVGSTGIPLPDHRIVVFGYGSAGRGIAAQLVALVRERGLSEDEARRRMIPVDREGPGLLEAVRTTHPTVLIGTSGQPGAFTEAVVREMSRGAERPIIFALSNPTSRSEGVPQQLLEWSQGRAIIGTGSPSPPVSLGGQSLSVPQINNSYVFPGLALGIIASGATRVSDGMIRAAAVALSGLAPIGVPDEPMPALLPPLAEMRSVSAVVATAVGLQAISEGLSGQREEDLPEAIARATWEPAYEPYELVS